MKMRSAVVKAALLCLAIGLPESNVLAQQKQQDSFKVPAENAKFIVSQNVDVEDVPNHIVRLFNTHTTIPNNVPGVNGLRLVEVWTRAGDLTDGSGTGYFVFVAENGDKLFARSAFIVQAASGKIAATTTGQITGGTGRLAGLRGVVRQALNFDPKPGGVPGESQYEIEYSIGK
jgi:hypothetical protein